MAAPSRSLTVAALLVAGLAAGAAAPRGETEKQEYLSTAEQQVLLREGLFAIEGKEAHVIDVRLPAGWVGERHYHTGDVFVYVVEGEFVVDVDGEERKVFAPGQVYHEAVEVVMQARNLSTTSETRLILFQVGDVGEPLMMLASPHDGMEH